MTKDEFEKLLDSMVTILSAEARVKPFVASKAFESRVRDYLAAEAKGVTVDFDPHPHVFPDIAVGEFGVEVKFTTSDTWRSVANSVFEGRRAHEVPHIYVVFGKMGGAPDVRWGRYEDCVIHVRTSHVPRFEVEMFPEESLFAKMGITYMNFRKLAPEEKMAFVRAYARGRLKPGERLWWLEEKAEQEHSLPIQVTMYMDLPSEQKRRLRAEAALLCPRIVKPSRAKRKYDDAAMYILTYHGILCPQARDLFSAGSVAMSGDDKRGGNYVERALLDIQDEMRAAASRLEDALFVEYWGGSVPPENRIKRWLELADSMAVGWKPSATLFLD
jgi:hypothetical protein